MSEMSNEEHDSDDDEERTRNVDEECTGNVDEECNATLCIIIEEAISEANDEVDWIKCNECPKWFHQFCVGVGDVAEAFKKCFKH